MQQASRVSDQTAFFYLGELVEFSNTLKLFSNPAQKLTENYIREPSAKEIADRRLQIEDHPTIRYPRSTIHYPLSTINSSAP